MEMAKELIENLGGWHLIQKRKDIWSGKKEKLFESHKRDQEGHPIQCDTLNCWRCILKNASTVNASRDQWLLEAREFLEQ